MNRIYQVQISIAEKKFDFLSVFRMNLDLNVLFGGPVEDFLKALDILHGQDAEKAVGRNKSSGDEEVQDLSIQSVEKTLFTLIEGEGSAHPFALRDHPAQQYVRTQVHVMVAVIKIRLPAVQAHELFLLRQEKIME
jgi:hypothetical protein